MIDYDAIWARMPEDERERVRAAPFELRNNLIELWANAEQNGLMANRELNEDPEKRESRQDSLDEQLLARCLKGQYGAAAAEAARECQRLVQPATSRRSFLRAMRKAVEASRREVKPLQGTLPLDGKGRT